VLIVAALGIGCDSIAPPGPTAREHHAVERGAAARARVDIDMSAGDLGVTSGAKTLLEGDFEFNVPDLKPVIAYAVNGDSGTLKLSQESASGSYENQWSLSLDETTPVDLSITLGAGDARLVLGRINLQSLAIRLGAGDLDVDLRGTPAKSYSVSVQAGAGDTTVRLPAGVGTARLKATIGVYRRTDLRPLPWNGPGAEADQLVVGDVKVPPPESVGALGRPVEGTFGARIDLLGLCDDPA